MVEEVVERPVRPNLSVMSFFVILFLQFHDGWTLPQIPSEQYQANIYIPQAPTDFSHPSEVGREFSPPTAAAVNQAPVLQDDQFNERPDYESQPNEEDFINERPRGRPYAGSFAEELDEATAGEDPEKSIPGSPEQDYPVFEEIPRTSFTCRDKPVPAYYADVEARCQVFHICDVGGHKHSFLCPNGSVFNQKYLVCDWWYDFACENAENLFSKQLIPSETPTTPDVNNAAQTFSNDGQLIYNQNLAGDYNLNPVFPGLPQTQLDTPQQVFTGNYYVPQNDIFHGAETGFPGRDLIHANLDTAQQNNHNENVNNNTNSNNENYNNGNNNYHNNQNHNNHENVANLNNGSPNNGNLNNGNLNNGNGNDGHFNTGNVNNGNVNRPNGNLNNENLNNENFNTGNLNIGNFNNENIKNSNNNNENFNNQNVNKPGEDIYNTENKNNYGKDESRSYIDKQPQKLSHESGDNGKTSNNFQNKRNEPHSTRKHIKIGRKAHNNPKLSTTQSSLNLDTKEKNLDVPQVFSEQSNSNKFDKTPEQVAKSILNETVGIQRNENNHNNNEQQYRTDLNGFNGNNYQTNVNHFITPTPNTQYIPQNTFREANNNFQANQYPRTDAIH